MTPTSPATTTNPTDNILSRSKQENHPNVGEQKQSSSSTKKHGVTNETDLNAQVIGVAKMTTTAPDNNRENRPPTHSNILSEIEVDSYAIDSATYSSFAKDLALAVSSLRKQVAELSSSVSSADNNTTSVIGGGVAAAAGRTSGIPLLRNSKNNIHPRPSPQAYSADNVLSSLISDAELAALAIAKTNEAHVMKNNIMKDLVEIVQFLQKMNDQFFGENQRLKAELNNVKASHEAELNELKEYIIQAFDSKKRSALSDSNN